MLAGTPSLDLGHVQMAFLQVQLDAITGAISKTDDSDSDATTYLDFAAIITENSAFNSCAGQGFPIEEQGVD